LKHPDSKTVLSDNIHAIYMKGYCEKTVSAVRYHSGSDFRDLPLEGTKAFFDRRSGAETALQADVGAMLDDRLS